MDLQDITIDPELFGRYQALRVYAAIARLPKAGFTTGDIARLTDVPTSQLSKESGRLCRLRLLYSVPRRGDYERNDGGSFLDLVRHARTGVG